MKYTITEKKALKKLGIPDFRHITKDKIVKFTSMIPRMDPEVAKAAIEQFPEFKDMSLGIVNTYKDVLDKLIESNDKSNEAFYSTCNQIIQSLDKELDMPELTSEDRNRIENKMIEVAQMIGDKDTENKRFHLRNHLILAGTLLGILATGASVLGSNSQISMNNDSMDDDKMYDDYQHSA